MENAKKLKLYSTDFSPFSTRVRIAIYEKHLPIEVVQPPGGVGSELFKQINPLGNIPTLIDGGKRLAESSIILEYLEDRFPDMPLRPTEPFACAQMRLQSRFTDLYLAPALYPLFTLLRNRQFEHKSVKTHIQNTREALSQLDQLLSEQLRLTTDKQLDNCQLHLGDCVLAPSYYYVKNIPPLFGETKICDGFAFINRWWDWVQTHQSVKQGLYETGRGFQGFLSNLQRPIEEINE